jgi:outer membrane protein OmpA-like peptidoglycan-associated protein
MVSSVLRLFFGDVRRPLRTLATVLAVLLAVGPVFPGRAQTSPPDSQTVRPEGVDRARQRIETIRRTAGPDRTIRIGRAAPSSPIPPRRSGPAERRPRADRSRFVLDRAQLRALIDAAVEDVLTELAPEGRSVPLSERIRPVPPDSVPIATDTVRAVPDTVRVVRDSVRLVRDTLRQTRVETIESAFLDEGVFRAFEVNFAFGTATLQPRATRTLDAVGAVLERYPDARVAVAGHTDATGPDSVNARLSRARAAAVRAYLRDRSGISPERLVARGYGEARPIASNRTPAGRALNRRVSFRVLNPDALSRPRR